MFSTHKAFWLFAQSVRYEARVLRTPEQQAFLDAIREGLPQRLHTIKSGSLIWRAAMGCGWLYDDGAQEDMPTCHPPPRMIPYTDRAVEGRVNVKGIPCFYGASKKETAITEIRPWIGSLVSVGRFEVLRDLQVVNVCTDRSLQGHLWLGEPPPDIDAQENVWQDIDLAFSEPVERTDDTAEYAPTQIIAELIRLEGYDGIAYGSSSGTGHNVALFDPTTVAQRSGHLLSSISVTAEECATPYFIPENART